MLKVYMTLNQKRTHVEDMGVSLAGPSSGISVSEDLQTITAGRRSNHWSLPKKKKSQTLLKTSKVGPKECRNGFSRLLQKARDPIVICIQLCFA